MSVFRGSDEQLEREIAAVQGLVRVRLKRATHDLRELESVLAELRRERRRRQLVAETPASAEAVQAASS